MCVSIFRLFVIVFFFRLFFSISSFWAITLACVGVGVRTANWFAFAFVLFVFSLLFLFKTFQSPDSRRLFQSLTIYLHMCFLSLSLFFSKCMRRNVFSAIYTKDNKQFKFRVTIAKQTKLNCMCSSFFSATVWLTYVESWGKTYLFFCGCEIYKNQKWEWERERYI